MRKWKIAAILLSLLTVLGGCGSPAEEAERLLRSDTVVNIPLNPETTEAETIPEETVQAATETVPEPTKAPSKSSGSKSSSSGKATIKATEPPETEPPVTESPEADIYDISDYIAGSMEQSVAEQINSYRTEAGLDSLSMDGWLCGIASVRAYEAAVSWSHTRPNGTAWQTVLSDYGCGASVAAEELGRSSGYDAASLVGKWMDSESHSADLLNSAYTTIGVGVYEQGGTVYLAVLLTG